MFLFEFLSTEISYMHRLLYIKQIHVALFKRIHFLTLSSFKSFITKMKNATANKFTLIHEYLLICPGYKIDRNNYFFRMDI